MVRGPGCRQGELPIQLQTDDQALFHAVLALPLLTLLFKLHKWNESAKFFDGSAIALQLAVVVLYLSVHIQSLRTFLPDAKSTWTLLPQPPPLTEPITEDDKIEAVRVLAAGNALVGILLIGVLGMQIGQEYAGNMEALEQKAIDEAARSASELKVEDKKNI